MMTTMTTVIIIIAMLMSIVPTTMAEAEEILGMLEEVMTVITVSEVFNIPIKKNQQSSKDILMKEGGEEEVEEEVSSFDNLLPLLNNNINEPSPMTTTRPSLWWWFTKDVLRRTTEGRTQLDEEDYDVDEECTEAERRNRNREIKVRVRGGNLVEEGSREEPIQERLYPKTRALTYTRFTSSLCILWRVTEAILWWLSLWKRGDGNYEGGMQGPSSHFNLQKAPSLSSGEVVVEGCLYHLLGGRTRKQRQKNKVGMI